MNRPHPAIIAALLSAAACSDAARKPGDAVATAVTMQRAQALASGLAGEWAGAAGPRVVIVQLSKGVKGTCDQGFCSWTYDGTVRIDHRDSLPHAVQAQFNTAGSQVSILIHPDPSRDSVKPVPWLIGVVADDSIAGWLAPGTAGDAARRLILRRRE